MINKYFRFIVFLNLLIIFSCSQKQLTDEQHADKLMEVYVENIEAKYPLKCIGVTWGMYGGVLELAGPRFITYELMDASITRQMIVELSKDLIERINSSKELRHCLKNFPFTYENVNIAIGYRYEYVKNKPDALIYAFSKKGKISYFVTDPETKKYKIVLRETLEEAVAQVKNQAPSKAL